MSNDDQIDKFVQKLKTVFDKSPEGMVISDMTNDDNPIVYANNTFLDMTGYSKQEIVGRNCRFLQNNDRDQSGIKDVRAAIEADEPCRVTLRNYKKDGSLFYNRLSLFPIHDQENKTKFYVGIQDDISDLIMSKEEIAELERLNEFKNEMMGMAAHDLRNPLTVILNYADFLIDDHLNVDAIFNNDQFQQIKEIKEASEYMVQIVENFLDISIFESGTMKLDKKNIDLVELINQAASLSRTSANKKNIAITTHLPDSTLHIEIDRHKFRQVLDNLLSNAIKFSHPDTEIEIGIKQSNKEKSIIVFVKDQGQGIPEDEIDQLFDPFPEISVEATEGEESTGLGLAIVQKIIEAHDGKIEVESEVGTGSTFLINIPK